MLDISNQNNNNKDSDNDISMESDEKLSNAGDKKNMKNILERRKFFRRFGWGAVSVFLFGGFISTIRLFYPRVLFEPPSSFIAGKPDNYPPGSVSTRFKDKYGVWIVRKENGQFLCLSTRCTHLGCIPNWLSSQNKFKCPCHGSGFYQGGINFEGPAPRPLDRYKIELSSEGLLFVDKSIVFKGIAGMDSDEFYPDSLLDVRF